jgi:sugar phosphate isomerase/epimerase
MGTVTLQNQTLKFEFSKETGALVGLTAVQTGWKILDRPQLGLSFRLMLPMEGKRNNPVWGEQQKLTSMEHDHEKNCVKFYWDSVVSAFGGEQDIRVVQSISLTERQAIYETTIDNRSELVVENVYSPYLGDLRHPKDSEWFKTFHFHYATAAQWNLWPTFDNLRGYYGVDFPIQIHAGAPMAPYFLMHSQKQGLYAGVYSSSADLVSWHTELHPGYGSSIDFRVPEEDTIGGKEVHTTFAAVHVPYIQPGETRELTPIALEAYLGDWHFGVDIYKQWRDGWMKIAQPPEWAREPHAWQQIHINSPEDELRIPFRELVKVGEECARHGVKAIQLVGWNHGGQDQGNPSHDPDTRLGTFEELKAAIHQIQDLGVKMILFAKFTWADRATQWFRDELVKYATKDPHGDYYHYMGYQYQTATQLLDINTKRLIPMCFHSQKYLELCDREFQKMVELGADGILFDECQHHSPALLCFDTSHEHRYGAPVYANDRKLIQNFTKISKPARPNFLYAGEACYDYEFETYHLAYHRSENKKHLAVMRFMEPKAQLMTAVTGFDDRNMINQCLMYRYIISYEPYNFKGHLDDYPDTMGYGKQMDALRVELRDYFWDGEFRDTVGATITANDKPYQTFSVFINAKNGKSGVVITNYSETEPVTVDLALDSGEVLKLFRLVDDQTWQDTAQGITVPPMSAAVVVA